MYSWVSEPNGHDTDKRPNLDVNYHLDKHKENEEGMEKINEATVYPERKYGV